MPQTGSRGRRADALSPEVVVAAAIELLDEHGERGFTFKLLTERLRTGAGAVYWHVANRDELVARAADRVLGAALAAAPATGDAEAGLRALALAVYDALDPHPWAAARVTVDPGLVNGLRLLERIGGLLARTTVPAGRHFMVATAIFNYVVGLTAQDSARAVTVGADQTRAAVFARYAAHWESLDPAAFPFLTGAADDLRRHDDRDQFVTGLDLILDGLRRQQTGR